MGGAARTPVNLANGSGWSDRAAPPTHANRDESAHWYPRPDHITSGTGQGLDALRQQRLTLLSLGLLFSALGLAIVLASPRRRPQRKQAAPCLCRTAPRAGHGARAPQHTAFARGLLDEMRRAEFDRARCRPWSVHSLPASARRESVFRRRRSI